MVCRTALTGFASLCYYYSSMWTDDGSGTATYYPTRKNMPKKTTRPFASEIVQCGTVAGSDKSMATMHQSYDLGFRHGVKGMEGFNKRTGYKSSPQSCTDRLS